MKTKGATTASRDKINRNALAQRRKNAIGLYRKGWTQYRIAKKIGVSFEAVSNWVEAHEENGMEGLISMGKPGPKPQSNQKGKLREKARILRSSKSSSRKKGDAPVKTLFGGLFKLISNKQ